MSVFIWQVKANFAVYLIKWDFFQLLGELQQADVISVALRHMGKLEVLYSVFPRLAKLALKVANCFFSHYIGTNTGFELNLKN